MHSIGVGRRERGGGGGGREGEGGRDCLLSLTKEFMKANLHVAWCILPSGLPGPKSHGCMPMYSYCLSLTSPLWLCTFNLGMGC